MAEITRDEVAHIARLARLQLTDDELDTFTGQLAAILEYESDLAGLDLDGVEPTSHPFELVNVMRPDEALRSGVRDAVLAEAPEAEGGMFKVPPVLGEAP
jgi:aspartyl-tRNA(Asn)/glutamyl-tRNA(Gln) amidotransferase subunit C